MQEFHHTSLVLSNMLLGKETEAGMGDSVWSPPLSQRDAPSRLQKAAQQWLLPVLPALTRLLISPWPISSSRAGQEEPPGASAGSPSPLSGIEPLIIAVFPL